MTPLQFLTNVIQEYIVTCGDRCRSADPWEEELIAFRLAYGGLFSERPLVEERTETDE